MQTMNELTTDLPNIQVKQERAYIRYRLLRLKYGKKERYCISVRYGKDHKSCLMPVCDIDCARAAFRSFVEGTVTPVTLRDVIEDFSF